MTLEPDNNFSCWEPIVCGDMDIDQYTVDALVGMFAAHKCELREGRALGVALESIRRRRRRMNLLSFANGFLLRATILLIRVV